jgi:hypothetical protein
LRVIQVAGADVPGALCVKCGYGPGAAEGTLAVILALHPFDADTLKYSIDGRLLARRQARSTRALVGDAQIQRAYFAAVGLQVVAQILHHVYRPEGHVHPDRWRDIHKGAVAVVVEEDDLLGAGSGQIVNVSLDVLPGD